MNFIFLGNLDNALLQNNLTQPLLKILANNKFLELLVSQGEVIAYDDEKFKFFLHNLYP